MNDKFSLRDFLKKYPNDDKCLEEIKNLRWPNGITCPECEKKTKFYKVTGRKAYACEFGGHQVFPLAGTIFEKSTTPLPLWFYAMFLMIKTRCGVSAKQLERELGVTYKTAWRIAKQIRLLMADTDNSPLTGEIEVDETFVGGKAKNRKRKWVQGVGEEQKEVVMGMLQRKGKVYLKHIPNTGKWTIIKQIKENIDPKARIITDQYSSYTQLKYHSYKHEVINHQEAFIRGDVHTQNLLLDIITGSMKQECLTLCFLGLLW